MLRTVGVGFGDPQGNEEQRYRIQDYDAVKLGREIPKFRKSVTSVSEYTRE